MLDYCHSHDLRWDRDAHEMCPLCDKHAIESSHLQSAFLRLQDTAGQLAFDLGDGAIGIDNHNYKQFAAAYAAALKISSAIDDLLKQPPPQAQAFEPPYVPIYL